MNYGTSYSTSCDILVCVRLFNESAAVAAFISLTLPGRLETLSVSAMIAEISLLQSEGLGSCLTKARAPAEMLPAACWRADREVKVPRDLNLLGLIEDRSCSTPEGWNGVLDDWELEEEVRNDTVQKNP